MSTDRTRGNGHNLKKKNSLERKKKPVKHLNRLPRAAVVFASLNIFKT